jgi:hypothetical protein
MHADKKVVGVFIAFFVRRFNSIVLVPQEKCSVTSKLVILNAGQSIKRVCLARPPGGPSFTLRQFHTHQCNSVYPPPAQKIS